jgi:hypothetical protein
MQADFFDANLTNATMPDGSIRNEIFLLRLVSLSLGCLEVLN